MSFEKGEALRIGMMEISPFLRVGLPLAVIAAGAIAAGLPNDTAEAADKRAPTPNVYDAVGLAQDDVRQRAQPLMPEESLDIIPKDEIISGLRSAVSFNPISRSYIEKGKKGSRVVNFSITEGDRFSQILVGEKYTAKYYPAAPGVENLNNGIVRENPTKYNFLISTGLISKSSIKVEAVTKNGKAKKGKNNWKSVSTSKTIKPEGDYSVLPFESIKQTVNTQKDSLTTGQGKFRSTDQFGMYVTPKKRDGKITLRKWFDSADQKKTGLYLRITQKLDSRGKRTGRQQEGTLATIWGPYTKPKQAKSKAIGFTTYKVRTPGKEE